MDNIHTNTPAVPSGNTDLHAPSAAAQATPAAGQAASPAATDPASQQNPEVQDRPSYESITWPEDISFQPDKLQAFKELAGELKLSSEQVQKLVDFETQAARENAAQIDEEKRNIVAEWARQTKALYGAKLDEEISFALRAANAFGGPEFRALLEDTGLGNHPVMIRTLVGIGRSISEDACPGGQPAAPQDKTFAEALYGK